MPGRASDNSSRNPRDQRTLRAFIAAQWTANEEGWGGGGKAISSREDLLISAGGRTG